MTEKRSVLFLCIGNSCRSQVAEAIVNHHFGNTWQAVSAGIEQAGYTHPKAAQVLAEIGIEYDGRRSAPMFFGRCPSIW